MVAHDIVVAGGGPAGLQFARTVARRSNRSIVVLERNAALADNNKSTGGTFDQVIDGFDVPDRVVMDATPDVIFEGPEARSRLGIPNYVLNFPAFLEFLGTDAASEGAEIRTGVTVVDPIVESETVVGVTARSDGTEREFRADVVVDATGPVGALTGELGMWDRGAAQRGIGKEFEVKGSFEHDSMLFRFDHEYAPGGYAWVFPAGDGVFKIGVCWVDEFYERHRSSDDGGIDSYVRRWIKSDDRWSVDEVRAVHAGEAVSDNSINRRADDGIVAVGDAVSSINPLFGEGIRPGMESAEMAAETVLDGLARGDVSREHLAAYERRWNRERGHRWRLQRVIGELLYDFSPTQQDRFVRDVGELSSKGADRLQRYDLHLRDIFRLYPFELSDVPKFPRLLRHVT